MFHGRVVVNRSPFCARPSELKSCLLAQERTSVLHYPTSLHLSIMPSIFKENPLICCYLGCLVSLWNTLCVMSSLAIFNLCCNAKLICCQFSNVYHEWNVYLVNKTFSRLLYLKCCFQGVFSCFYRLVAVIFIDLFLCLVTFAFSL